MIQCDIGFNGGSRSFGLQWVFGVDAVLTCSVLERNLPHESEAIRLPTCGLC